MQIPDVFAGTRPAGRAGRRVGRGATITTFTAGALVGTVATVLASQNGRALPATLAHVSVGISFIVAGVVARYRSAATRTGVLMCAVGFAWFTYDLYWIRTPLTFTANRLTRDLYLPILAHLFLAFPSGRLRTRLDRAVVAAAYVLFGAGSVASRLFADPRADACPDCPRDLLAVHPDAAVHAVVARVDHVLLAVFALLLLGLLLAHWRGGTAVQRRALHPALWASGPVILLLVTTQALYATGMSSLGALGAVGPLALLALPVGFLIGLIRSQLDQSAVGRLVVELGDVAPTHRLRDALARTLHDPTVELAYRVLDADTEVYVDAYGRPVPLPPPRSGRATTFIGRDGVPLAVLVHDASLEEEPQLVEAVAAAARLVLENERLQATVRAQLEDVRGSRARLVAAADAERRRLERDLHDGAQQRLVTLALMLRSAREQVSGDADPELGATLASASSQLGEALAELRELARGIHPAILTEAGLGPALESLADRTLLSTDVRVDGDGRLPAPVEASIYFVVCEALTNATKHAQATSAVVHVCHSDRSARVVVTDDGIGGADASRGSGLRGLADRVAALNGTLMVHSPPRRGTRVVAEFPCG